MDRLALMSRIFVMGGVCAAAAAQVGQVRSFTFGFPGDGGPERAYLVYEPPGYGPGDPAVVVLHGGGASMDRILSDEIALNRWLGLADEQGFLVVIPNGYLEASPFDPIGEPATGLGDSQTWNDLRTEPPGTLSRFSRQDDAGFIAEVVTRAAFDFGFDERAVFVAGSSNGGMMAHRMLIEHPVLFAGGCGFIANLPEEDIPDPVIAKPVMMMNGTADTLMPFAGGPVGNGAEPVRSGPATFDYWLEQHGLLGVDPVSFALPNREPVDLDPLTPDTEIVRHSYIAPGSSGPPPVVVYVVRRGGHAIPILPGDPALSNAGGLDTRGADRAWDFFASHLPATTRSQDWNGDGAFDVFDLTGFLRAFDAGSRTADLSRDGAVDQDDVLLLIDSGG